MAAICAVLVVILMSAAGKPAMAYVDGQPLACPSAATACRTACIPACNAFAEKMCSVLCALAPGAGQTCVNQLFTPCQVTCKNLLATSPHKPPSTIRVPKKETHCRDLESTSKTMADFALGLTKTAVEGTLSRVKSAIEEEAKLKEKVHQDLVFIIGEFQMMQSFLETAKWERAKNKVANTWVRQLRELAFDVEDCVEFVVHLDKDSAWWWRVVPSCMAPPRHLDEAAAEIKQLKARVEDVSHRNMRNNLISDSGSHSKIVMPMAPAATTSSPLAFDNLRQVWEAAGKIRDTGDLQDLIRHEDSDLRVISVWGSTGDDLGMTSIFSKAYCGKKISQEFKSRAWVKLIHPFNPEEFLKNLLTQFYESSHQANVDVGHLNKAQLMQQVMEHKYLIIVEGVSTVVEWNAIKMYLPNNKKGSRILVSTQDLGIALQSPGEPYLVSELGRFSDGKSLCAFFKRVSP
ncbi:disease resistance protein RGA4-like [Aegilops tauschii subsp. strangulata]|uniref:disease resistance protein RGA4-like n=1 Tax=Aegilops tauschii subsp. strangulata TaxID=200361 RepID=UPI003CC8A97A